ncbi:MFS transporter [Mesomycoplasma ovipneumoniae]|uniref:MFS transporter n=1 Tax=Mesomycoplasma ovipneumoniae TaxID=29562 RepID=UPI002963DCE3|nr:MFS transporter [Mesomycoplasma ovipneumoniae]
MIVKTRFFSKFKDFTWSQIFALIILAAADVFVIAAPYYLKNIVPNLHTYLGIREDQVASLTAIIGWVTLATQLPGGFLSNRISSRWLLFIAVLSTGIITFWFGITIKNAQQLGEESALTQYKIIWGLWGITSTLIFWTPLWKLVSQQTDQKNQGLAYGIQGSANGIVGFFLVFVIGLIITSIYYPDNQNTREINSTPFAAYTFTIGSFLVITSFLVLFFVKEKKIERYTNKISWESIKKNINQIYVSLKNWKLWMLSIFVMGMYTFQSVFAYYLVQVLNNVFLAPTILVTILGGIRTYGLRGLISSYVGYYADKFRSYILILVLTAVTGMFVILTILLLTLAGIQEPGTPLFIFFIILVTILFLIAGSLSWVMVTLRFTQVAEIEIGKNNYASSVGILSFIAFSPDAWFYELSGYVGKVYTIEGQTNTSPLGYQLILTIALGVALFGTICGLIVFLHNRAELKKLGKTNYRWRELDNA